MKTKNTWKHLAAGVLALSLVTGIVPFQPVTQAVTNLTAISASADTFEDLTYEIKEDNTVSITDYTGSDKVIVIPSDINGMKVTSIGDDAFLSCSLTDITIPDTVTSIGDSAFAYCSWLKDFTIPDSVVSIGDGAFSGCCFNLTSITIPDSVESIGSGAFINCSALKKFTVGENNKNYSSYNGVLYNKDKCCLTRKTQKIDTQNAKKAAKCFKTMIHLAAFIIL
ncbi:Leucine rich repeat-containing protein [Ruminococcus sp. YE71]|uniref:leucine-rich repeat domain-containing protein n=1 Tax=unclassified Ruminococcus TaxID=2608920 RepID=UPI000887966D|nr:MULTISPECIES: leucine-rich repeat domain-containing protein [unclassified Ruminococcus]SDA20147.1 Leucine rich repeat-containing protein [Ruminococcus sp. YE78]SFW31906.1 Leucine rich repeat-containing protein [Ruminococcus sp. YE71]